MLNKLGFCDDANGGKIKYEAFKYIYDCLYINITVFKIKNGQTNYKVAPSPISWPAFSIVLNQFLF